MITHDQFMRICNFTRQYLKETAATSEQEWLKNFPRAAEHRWQHTLNVLHNAEMILEGEKADQNKKDIIRVAVILHDISMFVCDHEIHGRISAEIAEKYLLEEGYPKDFVARVARAIAEHGTDLGPLPPEEQGELFSWEGKVVLEADILDKLGASTITDTLLILGTKDRLGFECRGELSNGRAMQRAAFFKDYIWTKTGKSMAEQRFGFFLKFLDQLVLQRKVTVGKLQNLVYPLLRTAFWIRICKPSSDFQSKIDANPRIRVPFFAEISCLPSCG